MFVTVNVVASVQAGDVVSYDAGLKAWGAAENSAQLVGVVAEVMQESAVVIFGGVAWARASREIPEEGGLMEIEAGGVYASSGSRFGVIAPESEGARPAGQLVMVHL